MQVARLTPSGLLPVVARSEYVVLNAHDGAKPTLLDKLCWVVYHGEAGPAQWRARIHVRGLPERAEALNRSAPLLDYEFDLVRNEREHADRSVQIHPRLTLNFLPNEPEELEWLLLCDPLPPFGWCVRYKVTGSVERVDAAAASYGGWTIGDPREAPRFPMPIYHVKGPATIEWVTRPYGRAVPALDVWDADAPQAHGFRGRAVWSRQTERWSFSYEPVPASEPATFDQFEAA